MPRSSKGDTHVLKFTNAEPRSLRPRGDQWRNNAFRVEVGNMPAGTFGSAWITEVILPRDASSKGVDWLNLSYANKPQPKTGVAYFKSVSGLKYEGEAVEDTITKIDLFTLKQKVQTHGAAPKALILVGFEPTRNDTRFIKSRTGHNIMFDHPGVSGRIIQADGRGNASWSFARGWLFNVDSQPIRPGAHGNVLLVPQDLRRGG